MGKEVRGDRRAREPAALDRLAEVLAHTAAGVEGRRAFTCAGCDAHCCRVGRNGMLVTRLEAVAIVERLRQDPALRRRLPALERRVRDTVRRYDLRASDPTREAGAGGKTYTCPFLDERNRCSIHGRGQPLGCITFMPRRQGGCDQEVAPFEVALDEIARLNDEVYGPNGWRPMLIPVAVERLISARPRREGSSPGGRRSGAR